MIIAISGQKRSGKDTIANMLSEKLLDTKRVSFAYPIKTNVYKALKELNLDVVEGHTLTFDDIDGKTNFNREYKVYSEDEFMQIAIKFNSLMGEIDGFYLRLLKLLDARPYERYSIRELLQYLGNDLAKQHEHDPIWVENVVKSDYDESFLIISDLRFDVEFDMIKNNGGKIIRVIRDGLSNNDSHQSENGLTKSLDEYDYVIYNNDSLGVLRERVDEVVESIQNDLRDSVFGLLKS